MADGIARVLQPTDKSWSARSMIGISEESQARRLAV
jgi:hypothetical protein